MKMHISKVKQHRRPSGELAQDLKRGGGKNTGLVCFGVIQY